MKAVDSAPSASSRRNRFGMRKATKNASVRGPAPKARATTTSRTNPRIRLVSVARPMLPTARTTPASTAAAAPPFSPGSGSVMATNSLTGGRGEGTFFRRGQHQIREEADQAERTPAAPASVHEAIRILDKAVSKGVLHPNTAARKKSGLARQLLH